MEEKEIKMGLTEEDIQKREEGPGIGGLFMAMGDSEADGAAIAASEDGQLIGANMAVMGMPEGSEESKAFWKEKGLLKKMHGAGLDKWASYIPVASLEDPERKFPLIFCLHGAHNPIQLTESYGIIQMAAREQCVVIAPENENWENIEALYNFAKENYPVDLSRVYSMGYSFGGFMSSRNVLAHPEIFAGAGMGGMLFASKCPAHDLDGQWYTEYDLTEEMLQKAETCEVPGVIYMGENEMLRLLPFWKDPEGEVRDGIIPLGHEDKQVSFNNWRRAAGCGPATYLAQGEAADPVETAIGAKFDKTEVRTYHGRKYFIGDSLNQKGECLLRTIAVEKMVHWPTVVFGDLLWEHLKHFARDIETGKLLRI